MKRKRSCRAGGRRISGWKRVEGNLWKTHLPEVQAGKWNFRQLFANDNRITRARTPNADAPEQKKILFSNALSILKAKPSKTIA
jgi:hypothetical protein